VDHAVVAFLAVRSSTHPRRVVTGPARARNLALLIDLIDLIDLIGMASGGDRRPRSDGRPQS
jgi:hypothetical protein